MDSKRSEIDRRLDEFDLARRALRWMLEHRVYWDGRSAQLLEPVSLVGRRPFTLPPAEIEVYILALVREVDLEAEHAS
jgi:hypothetical protein